MILVQKESTLKIIEDKENLKIVIFFLLFLILGKKKEYFVFKVGGPSAKQAYSVERTWPFFSLICVPSAWDPQSFGQRCVYLIWTPSWLFMLITQFSTADTQCRPLSDCASWGSGLLFRWVSYSLPEGNEQLWFVSSLSCLHDWLMFSGDDGNADERLMADCFAVPDCSVRLNV